MGNKVWKEGWAGGGASLAPGGCGRGCDGRLIGGERDRNPEGKTAARDLSQIVEIGHMHAPLVRLDDGAAQIQPYAHAVVLGGEKSFVYDKFEGNVVVEVYTIYLPNGFIANELHKMTVDGNESGTICGYIDRNSDFVKTRQYKNRFKK